MMSYLCENEAENIQSGYGYVAQEDAKCKKSSMRQWTMPIQLTLKKNSGAFGYLFYAYWATIRGPQSSLIPHPPTYKVDPYNGTPVSNSGREN